MRSPSCQISVAAGLYAPWVEPPMSDWCARLIDQNATWSSTKTGTNAVKSGKWLLPW